MFPDKPFVGYQINSLPNGPYLVVSTNLPHLLLAMGGTLRLALDRGIQVHLIHLDSFNTEQNLNIGSEQFYFNPYISAQGLEAKIETLFRKTYYKTVFFPDVSYHEHNPDLFTMSYLYQMILRKKNMLDIWYYQSHYTDDSNCFVDITGVYREKTCICSDVLKDNQNLSLPIYPEHNLPQGMTHAECFRCIQRPLNELHVVLSDHGMTVLLDKTIRQAFEYHQQWQIEKQEKEQIITSISWKVTEPLRTIKHKIRSQIQANTLRFKCKSQEIKTSKVQHGLFGLPYRPLISILLPVYNPPIRYLKECIVSVLTQHYSNWELCIADDASTDPQIRSLLLQYQKDDPDRIRVMFRKQNGHIVQSTNTALDMARGDFVALLDHDDLLTKDALIEVVRLLNIHPDADMVYSDEDKIDDQGIFSDPYYKPDWAPEMFLSQMYTCHLGVYRRSLVNQLGGFRQGFEGSQDYDLVLRLSELSQKIYHIPKILYHWRKSNTSCSSNPECKTYAFSSALRAVNEALQRQGESGWATPVPNVPGGNLVRYQPPRNSLISIVILTRDKADVLDRCLHSIFTTTRGICSYEIVLIDNGSQEKETGDVIQKWQACFGNHFLQQRIDMAFNYSYLNNRAVEIARGDLILLLNNDTEVLNPFWLDEMAGYAHRKSIGAVGARLLFPDLTVQHAGVVLGITGLPGTPGVAGHSHKYFSKDDVGYFGRLCFVSNYSAVTGACLMIRKSVYQEIGGMDEGIAVAFNDVDFCIKVFHKGYRNVVLPHVKLIHHESKTRGKDDTPEKQTLFAREVQIMLDRWHEQFKHDPYYNPNLTLWHEDFSIKTEQEIRGITGYIA
ncbi:MAG: glycosyltransferase family 2 protein [Desulfobacterales bacterium]|nr:glycosyltransferase family 2 protein [Desulfobacterales bacterium]